MWAPMCTSVHNNSRPKKDQQNCFDVNVKLLHRYKCDGINRQKLLQI